MNTNLDSMMQRCPDAVRLGPAELLNHRFRFAFHADVVPCTGSTVHGLLWLITPKCLTSLDRLEGFPSYYDRNWVEVRYAHSVFLALTYYMTPGNLDAPPPNSYFELVMDGYVDNNIRDHQLTLALNQTLHYQTDKWTL